MAYEYKIRRRVEFSETDMAGIVHYSNFFRYMEAAEHAFFRALGHSVVMKDFDPPLGLPRVHAECDYFAPLRFEDEVEIHLMVVEKKARSLRYEFRFHKVTAGTSHEVARGRLTVVCVARDAHGNLKAAPLPAPIAKAIDVAPPGIRDQPDSAATAPGKGRSTDRRPEEREVGKPN
jgi:YbgC/YbaW family acyl-CoA thioester hydrolase